MIEARDHGLTTPGNPARQRSEYPDHVRSLTRYADAIQGFLASGMRIEPALKERITIALLLQRTHGLLTNDALPTALMERLRLGSIATADRNVRRIPPLNLYEPNDIML